MFNLSKLLSTKSLYTKSIYRSGTGFAGFTDRVYQKICVTRLPHESFTLFIDTNDKVSSLFAHLQKCFPNSDFIATNKFQNRIGMKITQEDTKTDIELKQLEVVELLMHSNLQVYEKQGDRHNLCVGIQLKQYSVTNNRNLPEHIAQNIIQLSQQFLTTRSVQYALQKTQAYNELQHTQYLKEQQQLIEQAKQSYFNYLDLYKFYNKKIFEAGKARNLMANLIALMTANWIFLFGVTYGKYGWDVGEPLSYLTVLGVELIAMMGIFSMNDVIEKTAKQDFAYIACRMNLVSLLKTRQFLISYSKRHF